MSRGSEVASSRDWQEGEKRRGSRRDIAPSLEAEFPPVGLRWQDAVTKGAKMLREENTE